MKRLAALAVLALLCGCSSPGPIEGVYELALKDNTGTERYEARMELWELSDDIAAVIAEELEEGGTPRDVIEQLLENFRGVALVRPTTQSPERLVSAMLVLDGPFLFSGAEFRLLGGNVTQPRDEADVLSLLVNQTDDGFETVGPGLLRALLLPLLPESVSEFALRELRLADESLMRIDGAYLTVRGEAVRTTGILPPFTDTIVNLF